MHARLLRDTIDAYHYPLSPRVQIWKGILAKIRPEPPNASLAPKGLEPKPEPLPPQRNYELIGDGETYSGPPMTLGNAAFASVT
jgi:hypothetical protein